MSKKNNYNTTQLDPDKAFEKHIYHRDMFAHYLRWTHALKRIKADQNVLDFGCGTGALAEVFYRNRFKCASYIGLDIKKLSIEKANTKFEKVNWVNFYQKDLVKDSVSEFENTKWDMITSFEVIEHIGKQNIDRFLNNVKSLMDKNTTFLMSTPNYDGDIGAAGNHTYDSGDGEGVQEQEFDHLELGLILNKHFNIVEKYGTFSSQKDYKHLMNEWQTNMFNELSKYYDVDLLSVMMAPIFPEESRNCLWVLKLK